MYIIVYKSGRVLILTEFQHSPSVSYTEVSEKVTERIYKGSN